MRKGTSQKERALAALNTDHFMVDDRSLSDCYAEAQRVAKTLNFYDGKTSTPVGDWSSFFSNAEKYIQQSSSGNVNADLDDEAGDCPPHLGLFLTFLKLYRHAQDQLNRLTEAHLDFFYTKVLGERKKIAVPDKTYVFFELARNVSQYILPSREKLLAGKDQFGKNIIYATDHEIGLGNASVSSLVALNRPLSPDNSIYYFPIANSADGFGVNVNPQDGWAPFGNAQKNAVSAEIGFGIVSPLLLLKEGSRKITIAFPDISKQQTSSNFLTAKELSVQITTAQGWITKEPAEVVHNKQSLEVVIVLDVADPEITRHDSNMHGYALLSPWPLLKVVLKQGFSFSAYTAFQSIQFTRIKVSVDVDGANSLIVKNDYGKLDVHKAFNPFGFNPVRGSNFYVGIEESFYKPLERLSLSITFKGLPDNGFKIYYEGYTGDTNSLVNNNDEFKVNAAVRLQRKWHPMPNTADGKGEYSLFSKSIDLSLPTNEEDQRHDVENQDGLVRLTLSAPKFAFGHALYPAVYAKAIVTQLQNKDAPIPNEPYTPVVEYIQCAYAASQLIDITQKGNASFQYLHIKPFGFESVYNSDTDRLSAGKRSVVSGEFYHAGNLFLGILDARPSQQLILFFEIRELTVREKPSVEYHYLSDKGWTRLSGEQVLSDSTLGLKQTGILVLNLPGDVSFENPTMPRGKCWIRISVTNGDAKDSDPIVAIRTNAAVCSLERGSDVLIEVKTLPPNSITGGTRKIREIKKIEQPYASFGGRSPERPNDYFLRISEKLRHKVRGISAWDIERIILEQFPEIYKVKCFQHADARGNTKPGYIHIIVIPFVTQNNQARILKPFVPKSTLALVKNYIQGLTSPHLEIQVTNPQYEEVKVVAEINFSSLVDAGFYLKKMQEDLQYFLSPWAFRGDNDIELGSKLYTSSIIEFIETRPYVNFISTIAFRTNGVAVEDQVISLNDRTLVISAETHDIESIGTVASRCQTNQGVEEMIVDINFEVQ